MSKKESKIDKCKKTGKCSNPKSCKYSRDCNLYLRYWLNFGQEVEKMTGTNFLMKFKYCQDIVNFNKNNNMTTKKAIKQIIKGLGIDNHANNKA